MVRRGDLIWLSLDPTLGHEQKGRRPALVVSSDAFNRSTGMAFVCPITSTNRGYLHHIPVGSKKIEGFVMCEHLKSIDYRARKAKFIAKAPEVLMANVSNCIEAILAISVS